MTKRLGKGQGEGMMWETLRIVSDAVEHGMGEKDKSALLSKIFGALSGGHYDEDHATEAVSKMYYIDNDGNKRYGPYWTIPQIQEVYEGVKDKIPEEYNEWDFFVVMQMEMSDKRMLLEKWWPGISGDELAEKVADLAISWLNDPDSPYGTRKIWGYLHGGK